MMKKKSFRKVPKFILAKIESFEKPEFFTYALVRFPKDKVISNRLKKFGIKYKGKKLIVSKKFIIKSSYGKYSKINKFGKIIVRKDLPKIKKTFSYDAPNYGDWSKGSHVIEYERDVYIREFIKPRNLSIFIDIIANRRNEIVLSFRTSEILNKTDKDLYDKLLFSLNLLQENFGTCDVSPVGKPIQEQETYSRLTWEVLPPGWWSDKTQVAKLKERLGTMQAKLFVERLKYIETLNPIERYVGQSYLGNRLYYVFIFEEHALAECPMFGNAAYLLSGKKKRYWKQIFSKNKRYALNRGAKRILHRGNWKENMLKYLGMKLREKS